MPLIPVPSYWLAERDYARAPFRSYYMVDISYIYPAMGTTAPCANRVGGSLGENRMASEQPGDVDGGSRDLTSSQVAPMSAGRCIDGHTDILGADPPGV